MAHRVANDAIGISKFPTRRLLETSPSSDDVSSHTKNPYIEPIDPTSTVDSVTPPSTTGQSPISLYSSYGDEASTTDQFPMQHATQQLLSNMLPLATTNYVSDESQKTDLLTEPSSSEDSVARDTVSTSSSIAIHSDIPSSSTAQSDIPSTDSGKPSSTSSSSSLSSSQTFYSQDVSGTYTNQVSQSMDTQMSVMSPSSRSPYFTEKSKPASSSDYVPSTGDIATPLTASKTSLSSAAIALDTVSVKSTSAVPLTPPPNIKPVNPSDAQGTSILGGGLSDYIVYVGAPLCGLGILLLLIVCILCLRNRKAKSKGSPAKSQVQDLWVNSQAEIPLCNRSPLLEARLVDRHAGGQDLADSKLRRRKPAKTADVPAETVKALAGNLDVPSLKNQADIEDDQDENACNSAGNTGIKLGVLDDHVKDRLRLEDIEGCTTYEAVFDFLAEQDTHLSLRQGDLVKVTRKEDNGWWRGTVDNRIGWFPSNYVQAAPQDKLETENEVEMHNESHLSSFMVKKSYEPSPRNSYPTEEEIEAEPIYCKIQPKEKRKSTPKIPDKVTPPQQLVNRDNTPVPIEDGSKFKATYNYDGHFHGELHLNIGDIILGKEQDRNGWMNGYNETTGDEGWFPAVYVQKLPQEEPVAELDTDPASYKQLEANTSPDSQQDLVGIVHRAVHMFDADKAGDLAFEEGDLITVFQVLENGWWLGCKDKTVGWFPGSYVQMIDQPSPDSGKTTPSPTAINKEPAPFVQCGETTPKKSRLRPTRKAPPPPKVDTPLESKIPSPVSKIPKKATPMRAAPPAPPAAANADSVAESNVTIDNINKPEPLRPLHDGLYDLLNLPEEIQSGSNTDVQDSSKPKVPKRYIKPKLVTVPRSQVNLPNDSGTRDDNSPTETPRSRPPPPPRPKLGPLRVKLEAPRSPGHQSQSEEEEAGFFHLNNQVRVNEILRQDSIEPDIDANPYKGMSSFGSTFGKKEDKNANNHFNASVGLPHVEERSNFAVSATKPEELGNDTQTLDDTSPIVFNDKKASSQNDSFVINTNDMFHGGSGIEHEESAEPVVPFELEHAESDVRNRDMPVLSQESAEISVTPMSPKKKERPSRLAPPKPVTLSLETEQSNSNKSLSVDSSGSNTSSPGMAKIPKSQSLGEPVSKLPVIGRKETPVKMEEPWQHQPVSNDEYPIVTASNNVNVPEDIPGSQKNVEEISAPPQTKSRDETVNNDDSFEELTRPRTDSFGFDKPPVAPKPKSKGLPKLLPKPKAGLKVSPKENDIDTELNVDKGTSSDSSLPTTPVKKQESETIDKEEKAKEDDSKQSKVPLGSKIAQKSPQPRGRRSQIPASPGMRTKSKDRLENLQNAGKGSDCDEAPGGVRKVSESDSDAPLSPVTNIRRKPESPSGARRVKKGENSLRNRSNSPHERKGIPMSIKQRSNSPASKLPRSGIPKANTSSPASTPTSSNGPASGLSKPKPVVLDQDIHSPKSGPDSRVEATPSPDPFIEGQGLENLSPKPERPSKPPQVQKQKSQDGKPKQGKSLLPVIHKNMDAAAAQNGVSPSSGGKPKRGIPVAKPPRPPAPKSPSETEEKNDVSKRTLYQAVKAYRAQSDEELSFTEGTFVKELSDCDRPGWYVGMLADGTTGLYPGSHFKPSPVSAQSEA